ncbi:MAG TPA: nucleotide sugar dehydrogenase, partial [Planctomycetaceae bacterium]|nr:nucleotide sugar dehydrogenase [Planctomycetaceae bacterium]
MAKRSPREQLREYIQEKQATVGIVGLGYVGLPLIHAFVSAGFRCLGFDVDQNKVDQLNRGQSYIGHIPSTWLESWLANHQFSATSTPEDLANADAILMCVPTPLTEAREPDLSYVISSTQTISQILRPGQLIILESTTYPGTTRDVILPELEKTGLEVGKDFFLAYSPEREDPGNPDFSASGIPKVVGGYDPASCDLAALLYEPAVKQIIPVSSCEIAEAC